MKFLAACLLSGASALLLTLALVGVLTVRCFVDVAIEETMLPRAPGELPVSSSSSRPAARRNTPVRDKAAPPARTANHCIPDCGPPPTLRTSTAQQTPPPSPPKARSYRPKPGLPDAAPQNSAPPYAAPQNTLSPAETRARPVAVRSGQAPNYNDPRGLSPEERAYLLREVQWVRAQLNVIRPNVQRPR